MLNTTCQYEEPFYILPLNWISSFLSIPVYGIAFIVLLMKCPKHFDEYRKYIVIHIISGLLSDFHIRVIWKVSVFLPWPSLCSNGFAVEYALIMFYIFVILLFFTGATVLNLFLQRMSAITKHVENVNFQKFIYFLRYLFYASSGVAIILVVSIYPEFRNQKETKTIIEQIIVHVSLLFIPLLAFCLANFIVINNEYLAPFLTLMIEDHGSVSTFTLLITNKLLRKATRKLFLMPENLMMKAEQRVFKRSKNTSGIHVVTTN